jgi:hypothetical protein
MFSDPKIWHKKIIVGIPYIPSNQAWLSGKSTYSVDVLPLEPPFIGPNVVHIQAGASSI